MRLSLNLQDGFHFLDLQACFLDLQACFLDLQACFLDLQVGFFGFMC